MHTRIEDAPVLARNVDGSVLVQVRRVGVTEAQLDCDQKMCDVHKGVLSGADAAAVGPLGGAAAHDVQDVSAELRTKGMSEGAFEN